MAVKLLIADESGSRHDAGGVFSVRIVTEVTYKTLENPKGEFVSRVFVPDNFDVESGTGITGPIGDGSNLDFLRMTHIVGGMPAPGFGLTPGLKIYGALTGIHPVGETRRDRRIAAKQAKAKKIKVMRP